MCVDVHKSIAKMLGLSDTMIEEILQGVDAIDTDDKDKALLNFCIKGFRKRELQNPQRGDRCTLKAMGWSDVQVIEAVAITGYFNYINTLSNVFGLGE